MFVGPEVQYHDYNLEIWYYRLDKQDDRSYTSNMKRRPDIRQEILTAGTKALYLKGYNGTGVKDIVDAAGVPKGSFYNYFPSKEDFALEALRHAVDSMFAQFDAMLTDKTLPPLQRIQRLFQQNIDGIVAEGRYCHGCLIGNLCQELADTHDRLAKETERLFERHKQALATCLREAQAANDLHGDKDVETLAEFIFNSWEGALMRMKASKSSAPLDAFQSILVQNLLRHA